MLKRLMQLEEAGTPIRVAIIGCGRFSSMVAAQVMRAPGMTISVACDLVVPRAKAVLEQAGYDPDSIINVEQVSEANEVISQYRPVVTSNSDVAIQSEVDVVVEATGIPDAGAKHAFQSIMAGKHVVMVNVEADVLAGPILKQMADSAGVVYTLAYGDQPALIEDMYDWASSIGFDIVAAGKGTMYIPEFRKGTPDEALIRYGYTPEAAAASGLNARMYNSFLDGTKSAIEMCAVANMTGLVPDVPGMHFPPASIEEIPVILCPVDEGGILTRKGVVEVISCLRRDGSMIPHSLRWGVYLVISSDNPYTLSCIRDYGVAMDPSNRYAVMYRPYHFIGMETPVSITKAVLYGEPTGAPEAQICEVAAAAKRVLKPGEILDGEGGYMVYGQVVDAEQAATEKLLPIGLCSKAKVVRPVAEDAFLTYSDVQLPEGGFAWHLRQVQGKAGLG